MTDNPYTAPKSLSPADEPGRSPLPLILRWGLSLVLVLAGAIPIHSNLSHWQLFRERALIDPSYHPAPHLLLGAILVAAGITLFLRRKLALAFAAAHIAGAAGYVLYLNGRFPVSSLSLAGWALEGLMLWFMLNEWAHGRLR